MNNGRGDRSYPSLAELIQSYEPSAPRACSLAAVADYFLVERAKGSAWDHSKRRREQAGWDAHAAFMDALAEEGFVVLGGPIGDGDGDNALMIVDAESEAAVRARLAEDPWQEDMLITESVRAWSVWLRAEVTP
jgi:uncharacterized protein YciI